VPNKFDRCVRRTGRVDDWTLASRFISRITRRKSLSQLATVQPLLQEWFRHHDRRFRRTPTTRRSLAADDDAEPQYRERRRIGRIQKRRCVSQSIRAPLRHHSQQLSKAFRPSLEINVRERRQIVLHIQLASGILPVARMKLTRKRRNTHL